MKTSERLRIVAKNIEQFWAPIAASAIGDCDKVASEDVQTLRDIAAELEKTDA